MNEKNTLTYEYGGRRPGGLITVYGMLYHNPVIEFAGYANYRATTVKIWPVKKLRGGYLVDAGMKTISMREIKGMK